MLSNAKILLRPFFWLACCFTALPVAQAQVVVTSFTETGSLPANDDHYSPPVNLGFSINFGGANYSETYVSNNGYITFGEGTGDYTPDAFNAGYSGLPIIAAFFSDVDTSNSGSGIVSWGTGLVNGRNAFTVKWPAVGEYANLSSGVNSFALILVDRSDLSAGNFDVFFTYDQIAWDHGGAVAGFHNGNSSAPLFYQVPGSLSDGAFLDGGANSLASSSNTGATGDLLLQSRGGTFLVAPISVPEPSTYALLALGAGLLFLADRRRWA